MHTHLKQNLESACCYELCNVCGEGLELDWDVVVEYEEKQIACGDLKPVFGKNEIEQGTESCAAVIDIYQDLCCYTPPVVPCNLCETETDFLDAYTEMEVDFWGSPTNCSDAYDYLIRRIESDSDTCSSAKDSITDSCCYKKCSLCEGNQVQDFKQTVEFDGNKISCMQLHTVKTIDVADGSQDCSNIKNQFADSCCYDAPETPCILCAEGSVRKEIEVDFSGETQTCERVSNFLGSRMANGTEECASSKSEFMEFCCFDKCNLCQDDQLIDWDSYVEFEGEEGVSCGSFDWYFTSNAVEEGDEQCTNLQAAFSEKCCYTPIDYSVPSCSLCKKNDIWYDINGDARVDFQGDSSSCTDISNSLFRKAEDSSPVCDDARNILFDTCCFEKCNLCGDGLLDAAVEITYGDTATTCLELGLKFAANVIPEGSEECSKAKEVLFEPCCYNVPSDPCIFCRSENGQGDVRDNVAVTFYGASTTCTDLNSFLVSREEQVGFMCQAAKTELQDACCFEKCNICGSGGNLYWDNPVEFNGLTFACGELTWILGGTMVEDGSVDCKEMQEAHYDACCTGPSPDIAHAGNKCEICPSAKDWYAQVTYEGTQMTCLEFDSVLLRNGVLDQSVECSQAMLEYSSTCCYTPPVSPCNLCHVGQKSYSVLDKTISYNGAETNCFIIYNHLITRLELETDTCLTTQNDLFDQCCYDKCSLCENYQLDPEVVVTHEGKPLGCAEIENSYFGLNEITRGTEQCLRIQQQHFNDCCYDIPCNLCSTEDSKYELLLGDSVMYMGRNRTCGDVSVLSESDMSQSDACKATKDKHFDACCFKQCSLCKDEGWAVDWNHKLTYEGLASTCMDVYTSLRSERIKEGDDKCESIQFTISSECCYKMPTNQCALCQNSNGTFLNTNWNNEVEYQGSSMTCSDVNAMLSSEEIDSVLCLTARDDLWNQCCLPQLGGNGDGIGDILASDQEESSGGSSGSGGIVYGDDGDFGFTTMYRRNGADKMHSVYALVFSSLVVVGLVVAASWF